jgi:hypothetical protein
VRLQFYDGWLIALLVILSGRLPRMRRLDDGNEVGILHRSHLVTMDPVV